MANKVINTRIKNRVDTLANWQAEGVELLSGEIALVKVTETVTDAHGNIIEVPAVLMKVGEGSDKPFSDLPWLSAKAADVYEWAKNEAAGDIPVAIKKGTETATTSDTLGNWLKGLYDQGVDHESRISANKDTLDELLGDGGGGSLANMIATAIEALDSTTSGSGTFVKAVTQTDGIVAVEYGTIAESELPSIHTTKIIVSDAAGTEGAEGYQAAVTLDQKLVTIDGEISGIKQAIAGGVHFRGITTADLTDETNKVASEITLSDGSTLNAALGDVVIYGTQEYIWTATSWEPLGDVTRLGTLEQKVAGLNCDDAAAGTSKFVTKVTQTEGQIDVSYAQPTASDISYSTGSSVDTALGDHASRIGTLEDTYVKFNANDNKLYAGKAGSDMIIFDCGGANGWGDETPVSPETTV